MSNDMIANSCGFRFFAKWNEGQVIIGEEVEIKEGRSLFVESPRKTLIRLIKDGKVIHRRSDRRLEFAAREKGIYRVEFFRPGFFRKRSAWIFSNPIYVR